MRDRTEPESYSTYSRVIMTLSGFGDLFTPGQMESAKHVGLPTRIISNEQVKRFLDDPINKDITTVMKAEASRVVMARDIRGLEQEINLQKAFIRESLNELASKTDATASPAEKESRKSAKQSLENHFKKLNSVEGTLKQSKSQLSVVEKKITDIANNQERERNNFRKSTLNEVADAFDKLNLSGKKFLNSDEITELTRTDSWEEMVKRFKELNVEWPKDIDKTKPNYSAYFELKSYLAIRSALSRNFLPHDYANIMKHMKQLTDVFKKADTTGEAMFKQQEQITKELIQNEISPIVGTVKTNLNMLQKSGAESENLMRTIAPSRVEAIQERTKTAVASSEEAETAGLRK